ncbi:unnamed protein product, partial [Strongylus vulgaris]
VFVRERSVCLLDGSCVDIFDNIEGGEKYVVVREIGTGPIRLSTMLLKTPKGLTADKMDTTKWEFDNVSPKLDNYVTTMIGKH